MLSVINQGKRTKGNVPFHTQTLLGCAPFSILVGNKVKTCIDIMSIKPQGGGSTSFYRDVWFEVCKIYP